MKVYGIRILLKHKKKNKGNKRLGIEIDKLISDLERYSPSEKSFFDIRKDADLVHGNGFYFFNIEIHRTLIFIAFEKKYEATVLWVSRNQTHTASWENSCITPKCRVCIMSMPRIRLGANPSLTSQSGQRFWQSVSAETRQNTSCAGNSLSILNSPTSGRPLQGSSLPPASRR